MSARDTKSLSTTVTQAEMADLDAMLAQQGGTRSSLLRKLALGVLQQWRSEQQARLGREAHYAAARKKAG